MILGVPIFKHVSVGGTEFVPSYAFRIVLHYFHCCISSFIPVMGSRSVWTQ